MIVCGDKVRVKEGSDVDEKFFGKEGRIHIRRRKFNSPHMYEYEIKFFDTKLNHAIMGTVEGFKEDSLEVV